MERFDVDIILKEVKSNPIRYPKLSTYNREKMSGLLLTSWENMDKKILRELRLSTNNILG